MTDRVGRKLPTEVSDRKLRGCLFKRRQKDISSNFRRYLKDMVAIGNVPMDRVKWDEIATEMRQEREPVDSIPEIQRSEFST